MSFFNSLIGGAQDRLSRTLDVLWLPGERKRQKEIDNKHEELDRKKRQDGTISREEWVRRNEKRYEHSADEVLKDGPSDAFFGELKERATIMKVTEFLTNKGGRIIEAIPLSWWGVASVALLVYSMPFLTNISALIPKKK